MFTTRHVEQSILNILIRRQYRLHKDEEEEILRTFKEISYEVHHEAAERGLLPYDFGETMLVDYEPVFESPWVDASHRSRGVPSLSGIIGAISRLIASVRSMFRRQNSLESILQEEEERALFSTIEGIASQVNREAIEMEIRETIGGNGSFAMQLEPVRQKPARVEVASAWASIRAAQPKKVVPSQVWSHINSYIAFMDDELNYIGGIIDRNIATSSGRASPFAY